MPIAPVAQPVPWQASEVEELFGPWTKPEPTDVPPNRALLSLNSDYLPGFDVATRGGFGQYFNPAVSVSSIFNWIKAADGVSSTGNYLLIYDKTNGKARLLYGTNYGSSTDVVTVSAEAANGASSGNQLFVPTIEASVAGTPKGAAQCRVVSILTASVAVDKCFLGPLTDKPTLSEGSAGNVTAGIHFVGYMITTRSGYTGKICPVDGSGAPDATSTIFSTGGKTISFSLNKTWPTEATEVTAVMTAVTNPYQYFAVPGAVASVTGGVNSTVTFTINISDEALLFDPNGLSDVTNNQYLLTQDGSGNGPFSPWSVIPFGERISYMGYDGNGTSAIWISDPANPQSITEQFHKRRLPGFKKMIAQFTHGAVLCVVGPNWTYGYEDNNGQPSTWSQPRLLSGLIGSSAPFGVCVAATSAGEASDWAIVAHTSGLYVFAGAYQDLPLSYYIEDQWKTINWAAAATIRTAINHDTKTIAVLAPTGTATTPNTLFTFNYRRAAGVPDPDSVDFSVWTTPWAMRAFAAIQNQSTSRIEFALGTSDTKIIYRQKNTTDDSSTWATDDGTAIDFQYELGPQPAGGVGQVYAFTGIYTRAIGKGTPTVTSYSLDRAKSVKWTKPIVLGVLPGVEFWNSFYLTGERTSTRYVCGLNADQGQAGDWMLLSGVSQMYFPYATRRR